VESQVRIGALLQGLQQLGWSIGTNLRVDYRWAGPNPDVIRKHATELVAIAPDVIVAHGISTLGPLLDATRTIPLVFPIASDPVGGGVVEGLAHPGGNATGFSVNE
jgi:putative tryptophan/tyrosine transport system substrate-binding protein